MIVGSGLLAKAMAPYFEADRDVCVYAAGVSNSSCSSASEFLREETRLRASLKALPWVRRFVQFSTCSIADSSAADTPYVRHRIEMETVAREHPHHLIVRLPQVAGDSPNPHTLLNYLYARISRSEGFSIWDGARRNIIDVVDVARTVSELSKLEKFSAVTVNVASPVDHSVLNIVQTMERIVGKAAVLEIKPRDSAYSIDISQTHLVMSELGIAFDDDYLQKTLVKYYGN